jgi:hypothetical protein
MTLSCECCEGEPGDTTWYGPEDYEIFAKCRSTKCCSCGSKIKQGDVVGKFLRFKLPDTEIECRIYGEDGEIPRASWFMCEKCLDLYFSLTELGFCINIHEEMRELVRQYAEMNHKAKQP